MAALVPTLYCKPSQDGTKVGDCPFTHYVRMVLALKEVDYKVAPTRKEDKPAWLVEKYGGSMPCFALDTESGEGAVTESSVIAKHVDDKYPTPASKGGTPLCSPPDEAGSAAASSFFGAVARFIKNTDAEKDPELQANFIQELGKVEEYLKASNEPFLSGGRPGLADCSLAPKLWVMDTAMKHYKGFELDASSFPTLAAYKARMFETDAFRQTVMPAEEVLAGWGAARGG